MADDRVTATLLRWARHLQRAVCRSRLLSDTSAISVAEYALALAVIGAAIALAAYSFGNWLGAGSTEHAWQNASATSYRADGVRPGRGAFIRPSEMEVGDWYPIEFVAGPTEAAISEEAEGSPLTRSRPIIVGPAMRVALLPDPNFQIRSKSQTLQETGPDLSATWNWNVKPLVEGTHTLIATVDVLKSNPGHGFDVFDSYTRRVSVNVKVGEFQSIINDLVNAKTLGDALTALLKSWRATLFALSALIGAIAFVRIAIQRVSRPAQSTSARVKNKPKQKKH